LISFLLAIAEGIRDGFTGTHTAPMPLAVEIIAIPIGFMLLMIDSIMKKSTRVHI